LPPRRKSPSSNIPHANSVGAAHDRQLQHRTYCTLWTKECEHGNHGEQNPAGFGRGIMARSGAGQRRAVAARMAEGLPPPARPPSGGHQVSGRTGLRACAKHRSGLDVRGGEAALPVRQRCASTAGVHEWRGMEPDDGHPLHRHGWRLQGRPEGVRRPLAAPRRSPGWRSAVSWAASPAARNPTPAG